MRTVRVRLRINSKVKVKGERTGVTVPHEAEYSG
jgi:hypothetical protein